VHGGEAIFGTDIKVGFTLRFIEHMGAAVGMHLDDACEEVGLLGNDVAVLSDASDFPGCLHVLQKLEQASFPCRWQIERGGKSGCVQRALGNLAENRRLEFLGWLAGGFRKTRPRPAGFFTSPALFGDRLVLASPEAGRGFREDLWRAVLLDLACTIHRPAHRCWQALPFPFDSSAPQRKTDLL
jgi:hypothetical protein